MENTQKGILHMCADVKDLLRMDRAHIKSAALMLARIDEEGLPCYLETMDPNDVPLYKHFGFKVVDESTVPATSLTNWAMLRDSVE
jgi:hypothetical protein